MSYSAQNRQLTNSDTDMCGRFKLTVPAFVAAIAALTSSTQIATASDIAEITPCATVVTEFDQQRSVREIVTTITNVMVRLDDAHTSAGERSVLAPLSENGRTSMISATIEDCRYHPEKRLGDAASDTYEGLRGMQRMINGGQ